MYEYLFQTPLAIQSMLSNNNQPMIPSYSNDGILGIAQGISSNLQKLDYELKATSKDEISEQFSPVFNRSKTAQSSNSTNLTNDYLIDQKLRNSGLYAKLKNKTIYSQSDFVRNHSMLNSGIL